MYTSSAVSLYRVIDGTRNAIFKWWPWEPARSTRLVAAVRSGRSSMHLHDKLALVYADAIR